MQRVKIRRRSLISAFSLLAALLLFSCATPSREAVTSDISKAITEKDSHRYGKKEVFIIADRKWEDVLSLVPVTVWTEKSSLVPQKQKVIKYPTLIYHDEGDGRVDADSIINFIQQYQPKKVTVVGKIPKNLALVIASHPGKLFGGGLKFKTLNFITPADYLSYWKHCDTVVYVQNDYDMALPAATFASLINAPLIVKGSKLDKPANFSGKKIICIGKKPPALNCATLYNKDVLLTEYLKLTRTNKLVLVNANDLSIGLASAFQPEKTAQPINTTFSKLSLGAPFLAAAKHALILSANVNENDCGPYEGTSNAQFVAVDKFVKLKLQTLYNLSPFPSLPTATPIKVRPRYLTIVASPKAIPYWSDCNNSDTGAADWQYGSMDNEDSLLYVGRIYSITISDVSAYIARALFYETLISDTYGSGNYTGLAIAAPNFMPDQDNAQDIRNETVNDGYASDCFTWQGAVAQPDCDVYTNIVPADYQDRQFISFADHGSSTGWGSTLESEDIPWLDMPYTFSLACLTNNFWGGGNLTFGPTWLRKGGISYHASIPSTDGYHWEIWSIQELTTASRRTLGKIANTLIERTNYNSEVKRQYMLLGDPTLIPHAKEVTW
jgi:hypothetical protein